MIDLPSPTGSKQVAVAPDQEQSRRLGVAERLPLRELDDPHQVALGLVHADTQGLAGRARGLHERLGRARIAQKIQGVCLQDVTRQDRDGAKIAI